MPKAVKVLIGTLKSSADGPVSHKRCPSKRKSQHGISLLEILVVLAIMGALIAITAPSAGRYLDALTFKTKTEEIARDIARMRIQALVERRILFFPQADERGAAAYVGLSESLPEGWTIEGEPVVFFESGACTGGELLVTTPEDRAVRLKFTAPHCRFVIESGL